MMSTLGHRSMTASKSRLRAKIWPQMTGSDFVFRKPAAFGMAIARVVGFGREVQLFATFRRCADREGAIAVLRATCFGPEAVDIKGFRCMRRRLPGCRFRMPRPIAPLPLAAGRICARAKTRLLRIAHYRLLKA